MIGLHFPFAYTDQNAFMYTLLAGYKFVERLISAAYEGKSGVVEPSFVYIKGETVGGAAVKAEIGQDLEFFSVPVELGVSDQKLLYFCGDLIWLTQSFPFTLQPNGISKILPIGTLSAHETELLKAALPELAASITSKPLSSHLFRSHALTHWFCSSCRGH